MIDMHTHWRPAEFADALRTRSRDPRIVRNKDGVEVLMLRGRERPLAKAFDDVDRHVARMDRQGLSTSVLSLQSAFFWIQTQPAEESLPLCRLFNDSMSRACARHEGRLAAYAAVPLLDIPAAAAEFDRAMNLPGMVGVQLPLNYFLNLKDAQTMCPLFEVANSHRAVIFIHYGPRPGDPFPRYKSDTDNHFSRNRALEMQANLSSGMVTLCMTDFLAPYPDAMVHIHNLGGNIPFEVERMDHRCLLDTPGDELPSARFRRAKVYVDCNSFGAHAIEMAVHVYGADRIVCGTDGTEFGVDWTTNALAAARIGDEVREKILYGNARAMLSHLVKVAQQAQAAA